MYNLTKNEFLKLRSFMKWGVKLKTNKFENGRITIIQEEKVFTPVKYLETAHIKNIINMLKTNPGEWNKYPHDLWIEVLNFELKFRNLRIDAIFKEIAGLSKFSVLSEIGEDLLFEHI